MSTFPRLLRTSSVVVALMAAFVTTWPHVAEARESATTAAAIDFKLDWIVTPEAARELIEQGALVLDARDTDLKKKQGRLANAAAIVWQDLSEPDLPVKGRLLQDTKTLTKRLQSLGVTTERAIVVVADPVNGWGEDGRIAWALRTLGHPKVVIADGGLPAIQKAGPLNIRPPVIPGNFQVTVNPQWQIEKEEIRDHLQKKDLAILDVREPREYEGGTPYGESRGGHIPGAQGLWYKNLLAKDGKLLPRAEIQRLLATKSATKDSDIVAYCTGGIRSGWFTVVLNDLGYKARNYPGSAWDWAGAPVAEYPLIKGK